MKKVLSFVIMLALVFSFAGCEASTIGPGDLDSGNSSIIGTITEDDIDYKDAASFEAALNNGEKVSGKIVQFDVIEYKPNSAIGINCWSGEHLNFISENEIDVEKGDIIIGLITKEPTKKLGSWTVPYSVLVIGGNKAENDSTNVSESTSSDDSTPNSSSSSPSSTNSSETDSVNSEPSHTHSYTAATCTAPKTCSTCGATSGSANGHSWANATCTVPKTCSICKTTTGNANGHSWVDATYTAPKTCSVCKATEGNPLTVPNSENYHGHVYTGGSSSKKYHYEAQCAGNNSHEITWDEVSRRNLGPCGTCVLK